EQDLDRYIKARGRDVHVAEAKLIFDASTGRLALGAGSRKQVKREASLDAVLDVLRKSSQPLSRRQIEDRMKTSYSIGRSEADRAIERGIKDGLIAITKGPRNADLHTLTDAANVEGLTDMATDAPVM